MILGRWKVIVKTRSSPILGWNGTKLWWEGPFHFKTGSWTHLRQTTLETQRQPTLEMRLLLRMHQRTMVRDLMKVKMYSTSSSPSLSFSTSPSLPRLPLTSNAITEVLHHCQPTLEMPLPRSMGTQCSRTFRRIRTLSRFWRISTFGFFLTILPRSIYIRVIRLFKQCRQTSRLFFRKLVFSIFQNILDEAPAAS